MQLNDLNKISLAIRFKQNIKYDLLLSNNPFKDRLLIVSHMIQGFFLCNCYLHCRKSRVRDLNCKQVIRNLIQKDIM